MAVLWALATLAQFRVQGSGLSGCAAALPGFYRYLREAHDRTTRCCAPVPSALAMLAFSCLFPAGACGANSSFIIHHWLMAPWMLARASAKLRGRQRAQNLEQRTFNIQLLTFLTPRRHTLTFEP